MYPRLRFKIEPQKDLTALYAFIAESSYDNGRNLAWACFKKYPILKKYKRGAGMKINHSEASNFINNFYKLKLKIFTENAKKYQSNWQKVAPKYFLLVDKLFFARPWPKGKYFVYLTIWGLYPKYLEDKTFLIPYQHKNKNFINLVIAHELLHFMFFDYFFKKYKKYRSHKYDFFVWHVSEIFNSLILNSKDWQKIFKLKNLDYPEHKKIISRVKKRISGKKLSIDLLIAEILSEVEKIFSPATVS